MQEKTGRRPDGCRWLTAFAALVTLPALAATDPDTLTGGAGEPGATESSPELAEVVVHARRREERIQDSPLAVSVRTGEELRQQSADLASDVGRGVPNVYMVASPQSVNALNITMRGQSVVRSAITFDSAVGVYVDGVYVADTQGALATLLDIDSVEIVRGSQGTLFGRNSTGGAVQFFTHKPDLASYSVEAALSGGDYRQFMERAVVNLPLDSTFGLRFAYQGNSREGYGYSEGSGQTNLQNQHRYTARASALWKPRQSTEVFFTYEHFETNEHGAILHPLSGTLVESLGQLFASYPTIPLPVVKFPSNPFVAEGDYWGFDKAKTDALQLTVSQRLTEENIAKLILGYRRLGAATALDVDASPIPFADTELINTSEQKSAELQLSGTYKEQRFDWVGGLYWFRDDGSAPSVHQPASQAFIDALNELVAQGGPDLTGNFPPTTYNENHVVNISDAAYLHSEGFITPQFALAAGARYTQDQREIQENDYRYVPDEVGPQCTQELDNQPIVGPCPDINKVAKFHYWSWEISSHYRLSRAWNTYARIGRSYRSGGWNTPLGSYNDVPYRPEQLTDYELGTKANLFGDSLVFSADVFYGQYDDMQRLLGTIDSTNQPDTLVINAGHARVSGAEFEGVWRPMRPLTLHGSAGWTDGHYQSFTYIPVPGQPPVNLAGNSFNETPPYQFSLGAQYERPVSIGRVRLSADYAYQGKVPFNVINDFNYQPGYGTLNARLSLSTGRPDFDLALYGTNLTDVRYAYNGGTITIPPSTQAIFAWQVPGPPRMVAVEARYRWSTAR
jgi:iron complex outermembrane receptor protein